MIAYSSVSHSGFVLLGIAAFTAEGINGAIYQMVSHGILSAMLFLLTGVLYDRTHDRRIGSLSRTYQRDSPIHGRDRHLHSSPPRPSRLFGICR